MGKFLTGKSLSEAVYDIIWKAEGTPLPPVSQLVVSSIQNKHQNKKPITKKALPIWKGFSNL